MPAVLNKAGSVYCSSICQSAYLGTKKMKNCRSENGVMMLEYVLW